MCAGQGAALSIMCVQHRRQGNTATQPSYRAFYSTHTTNRAQRGCKIRRQNRSLPAPQQFLQSSRFSVFLWAQQTGTHRTCTRTHKPRWRVGACHRPRRALEAAPQSGGPAVRHQISRAAQLSCVCARAFFCVCACECARFFKARELSP